MKTKEEIQKLSYKYSDKVNMSKDMTSLSIADAVTYGYNQCQEDMSKDQTLTRFEVIDENGRAYTEHYCKVELSYQDDGRTLKVFIKPLDKQD